MKGGRGERVENKRRKKRENGWEWRKREEEKNKVEKWE